MVALATAFVRVAPEINRAEWLKAGTVAGALAGEAASKAFNAAFDRDRGSIGVSIDKTFGEADKRSTQAAERSGRKASASFGKGFGDSGGTFARVAATLAARATLIGTAAAAAAPGVIHLTAALAPAAGAAVALPAAFLASKAAMVTFKVATSGVGDAIKNGLTGTAAQAKKALEALPPPARAFAKSIIDLKKPINDLRSSVAGRFFLPLQNEITPLARIYFPMLRTQMGDLAGALGGFGEQLAHSARSAEAFAAVRRIFAYTTDSVVTLRGAVSPLTLALSALVRNTASFLPGLAQGFVSLAQRVSAFVQQAAASGRIREVFVNAMTTLRDLAGVVVNVGSILGSVFKAATAGGNSLLSNLRALTGQAAAFLRTGQGMGALQAVFSTLAQLGAALRTSLAAVLPAVARSLAIIGPAIAGLAMPAAQLVTALAPLLPYFTSLAAIVLRAVTPAIAALAGWLARNADVVKIVASVIAGAVATMRIIAVVTKVWAVAQVLLNIALTANPIGIVVVALAALVAGLVVAYRNSETFRNFVNKLGASIVVAWGQLRSVIGAVSGWFTGTIIPSIRTAVQQGAAVFRFFQNVGNAVFIAFRTYVTVWWNIVRAVFVTVRSWLTIVGTAFRTFAAIGGIAFRTLGAGIRAIWDSIRTGSFTPLRTFITQTLPGAFRSGVAAIRAAWDRVKEAARTPVRFVVNSVVRPFMSGVSKIAGFFGVKNVPIPAAMAAGGLLNHAELARQGIPGYASGGRISGMPSTVDNRLAPAAIPGVGAVKLAGGEFIVNAKDTAKALPILQWINDGMRQGGPREAARRIGRKPIDPMGDGSEGWAFAGGGLLGWVQNAWGSVKNLATKVWDIASDPIALIKKPFEAAMRGIPGAGQIRDMMFGAGRKIADWATKWISGAGGAAGGNVGNVQAFVRAQAGKPYIWASAGPRGYDCSGIVSAAYNLLHGRNPYHHTFSTEGLPGRWFAPGVSGALLAGWSHPGQSPASSSTGHMAGQIGNLPFESRGSRGVVVGGAARRIGQFANVGHARAMGGLIDFPPIRLFDRGGFWPSGTLGANLSGRTEYVSTGKSGAMEIHNHFYGPVTDQQAADAMIYRSWKRLVRDRKIPG